jgi:NifU-like protein involved in Fe-S cluster formation
MGMGAKPGYGPKEPTEMRGEAGGAKQYGDAKRVKGMAINPAIVRGSVDEALAASASLRNKVASGDPGHAERQGLNQAMAQLQQHDSLAHASVLAIHTLEERIAKGEDTPKNRDMLKQAHANLRARLAQGARAIRQ